MPMFCSVVFCSVLLNVLFYYILVYVLRWVMDLASMHSNRGEERNAFRTHEHQRHALLYALFFLSRGSMAEGKSATKCVNTKVPCSYRVLYRWQAGQAISALSVPYFEN
jgi:hypothetical protein